MDVEGCRGSEVFLGQKSDGAVSEVTPCQRDRKERKERKEG